MGIEDPTVAHRHACVEPNCASLAFYERDMAYFSASASAIKRCLAFRQPGMACLVECMARIADAHCSHSEGVAFRGE